MNTFWEGFEKRALRMAFSGPGSAGRALGNLTGVRQLTSAGKQIKRLAGKLPPNATTAEREAVLAGRTKSLEQAGKSMIGGAARLGATGGALWAGNKMLGSSPQPQQPQY
jgi:hypothetical protein